MFIGSPHNLNNNVRERPVEMNKNAVPQVNTFRCLGVDLDEKLGWKNHIDSVCHRISRAVARTLTGGGVYIHIFMFRPTDFFSN